MPSKKRELSFDKDSEVGLCATFCSLVCIVLVLSGCAAAPQYSTASTPSNAWSFQTGVFAPDSTGSSGANITIQTITQPIHTDTAFWVGEILKSVVFIQVGYEDLTSYGGIYNGSVISFPFAEVLFGTKIIAFDYCIPCSTRNGTWHNYSMFTRDGQWYFSMDNQYFGNVSYSLPKY